LPCSPFRRSGAPVCPAVLFRQTTPPLVVIPKTVYQNAAVFQVISTPSAFGFAARPIGDIIPLFSAWKKSLTNQKKRI
jgi:hypothetical protein